MNCKDCIHYFICIFHAEGNFADKCRNYKSKSDFVEVVRCKDCKYYDGFYSHRCTNTDLVDSDDCYARIDFAEDDFCSYGERKEGD